MAQTCQIIKRKCLLLNPVFWWDQICLKCFDLADCRARVLSVLQPRCVCGGFVHSMWGLFVPGSMVKQSTHTTNIKIIQVSHIIRLWSHVFFRLLSIIIQNMYNIIMIFKSLHLIIKAGHRFKNLPMFYFFVDDCR